MKINKKIKLGMFLLVGILLMFSLISAYTRTNQYQYSSYTSEAYGEGYWRDDRSMCEAGQDFVIQIAPFGCEPAVVRSDLLEEQNVPVFCQLAATKINPLIDVDVIEHIDFTGDYPDEVSGIGFHPAKAALGGVDAGSTSGYGARLNSPILNNIGYVVIVLKKQKNESAMPEYVEGNLTAKIRYDIKNAYGIGRATFYLPELNDGDWEKNFPQYGFWNSRGYLRAESIEENGARISIYADDSYGSFNSNIFNKKKISSVRLERGETSKVIFLPGFDCLGGVEVRLDSLENPDTRAKLEINGDIVEVTRGEKFLENKCSISGNLINDGLFQKISVYCNVDEGDNRFDLSIHPKIYLDINGEKADHEVGDYLYETGGEENKFVYLAYIGSKGSIGKVDDLYIYLIATTERKSKLTEDEISSVANYDRLLRSKDDDVNFFSIISEGMKKIAAETIRIGKWVVKGEDMKFIPYSLNSVHSFGKNVKIVDFAGAVDLEISNEYYNNAMNDYDKLVNDFSNEKKDGEKTFGEVALIEEIILTKNMGQGKKIIELCEQFSKDYPNSESNELVTICNQGYKFSDSDSSTQSVLINGEVKTISFNGIYEPSLKDYSAEISVRGPNGKISSFSLRKNQIRDLGEFRGGENYNEYIQLIELDEDSALVSVNLLPSDIKDILKSSLVPSNTELKENIAKSFGSGYVFTLTEINLRKVAKVSLIPNVENEETKANFSFRVGIEKREEDLLPDKIEEKIEDINETIEDWEEISEDLGDVVEGFKKSCLGVGALLTVKNLITNVGGKSIARQNVMRGEGGVYDMCSDAVNSNVFNGKSVSYKSVDECMYRESDYIDNAVDSYYKELKEQNAYIKQLQDSGECETNTFLGEKSVNTNCFKEAYLDSRYKEELKRKLKEKYDGDIITINDNKINIDNFVDNLNASRVSAEELRDLQLYSRLDGDLDNMAKENLKENIGNIYTNTNELIEQEGYMKDLNQNSQLTGVGFEFGKDEYFQQKMYSGGKTTAQFGDIDPKKSVQGFGYGNNRYLFELKKGSRGEYNIVDVYDLNGKRINDDNKTLDEMNKKFSFKKYDRTTYENEFKSTSGDTKPKVKYYETEPYKGYPAIVPFDLDDGWYAATKQTLPILGNIRSYDESGRVTGFYVCNVGENNREEFKSGIGDDVCEMINTGTGQAYDQFPGLDRSEASKIIRCAVDAIEDASKQYKSGVRVARISTSCGSLSLEVGKPVADIPDMQCQDFMSPKDCRILFNVCDPVVCPSSRCDFGGAYPVKDVIQSGIIGGIALCLPNIREGILVPVCLSGIKAGIDGLLSVFKAYRDCLQESLDTGEMVGICDEIYSVHLCEFLWRQGLPLAQIAIPKMLEFVTGQNVHGGGEYLGVQSAWTNAENSVTYFTQYYAANSYKAYKARTAEDVGDEVCENYASAVYPEGGDILDALTEPDSPPQFHGRFDEIPFTDVTNPPLSHYKVYYHIYAGEDSRAYYNVYLSGAPGGSFYQDTSYRRTIASGFIGKGEYASETKDFTAPSGYKQMCINVNGQEECGFKQVSTSFAINYVTDKYVASQADEIDIKSERECVSGSVSAYSLLNPSMMGAAEEITSPAIYDRGIIRICATDNPGKGTDLSRWKEVGYCGDKKLKCYLDEESVKNAIKGVGIEEDVLNKVNNHSQDILRSEGDYLTDEQFLIELQKINAIDDEEVTKDDAEEVVRLVDEIFDKVFWNNQKAYLLLLRGNAYGVLAEHYKMETDKKKEPEEDEEKPGEGVEIRNRILEIAKNYADSGYNHLRIDENGKSVPDNVCASFVTKVLIESGIKGIEEGLGKGDYIDYLTEIFEEKGDFFIIANKNDLEKGDLVILGSKKQNDEKQHIAVFSHYNGDKTRIYAYGDPGTDGPVKLQNFPMDSDDWYFYMAYRFTGIAKEIEEPEEGEEIPEEGLPEGYEGFEFYIELDDELIGEDESTILESGKEFRFGFGYKQPKEYTDSHSWYEPTPIERYKGEIIDKELGEVVYFEDERDYMGIGEGSERRFVWIPEKEGDYIFKATFSRENNYNWGNIITVVSRDFSVIGKIEREEELEFYVKLDNKEVNGGEIINLEPNKKYEFTFGYKGSERAWYNLIGASEIDMYSVAIIKGSVEIDRKVKNVLIGGDDEETFEWIPQEAGEYIFRVTFVKGGTFNEDNIVKVVNRDIIVAEREKWTLESALEKIDEFLKEYGNIYYSDEPEVELFIKQLNKDWLLSDAELDEIDGGIFGAGEENLDYVKKLLLTKK